MAETVLSSVSSAPSSQTDEFNLLCACARANPSPEQTERMASRNYAGLDWNSFLRLAEHHGILALVARNLTSHAHGLPAEVVQSLRSAYAANLRRSLWLAAELMRI